MARNKLVSSIKNSIKSLSNRFTSKELNVIQIILVLIGVSIPIVVLILTFSPQIFQPNEISPKGNLFLVSVTKAPENNLVKVITYYKFESSSFCYNLAIINASSNFSSNQFTDIPLLIPTGSFSNNLTYYNETKYIYSFTNPLNYSLENVVIHLRNSNGRIEKMTSEKILPGEHIKMTTDEELEFVFATSEPRINIEPIRLSFLLSLCNETTIYDKKS